MSERMTRGDLDEMYFLAVSCGHGLTRDSAERLFAEIAARWSETEQLKAMVAELLSVCDDSCHTADWFTDRVLAVQQQLEALNNGK